MKDGLDVIHRKLRRLQVHSMHLLKTFLVLLFLFVHVNAQGAPSQHVSYSLHPNLAIIIGILSIMFAVLFLLLACAEFCHSALSNRSNDQQEDPEGVLRSTSGIERSIIDSLPFFTFSSLKGSKEGLECAVCLSKFEDTEVLRLLPRCRHAFHMNCIDKWLESHSSCPICRHKFDAGDFRSFSFTNSLRYPQNSANLSENPNLDLFIQREQEHHVSSRFNMVGSLQKLGIGRKEDQLIPRGSKNHNLERDLLHKFKHKIIVSDLIYKSRWSDVNSSDLMFLNSEMLNIKSSQRFSPIKSNSHRFHDHFQIKDEILTIKEDIERKRSYESKVNKIAGNSVSSSSSPGDPNIGLNQIVTSKLLDSADKRSMSEIINISRYADIGVRNRTNEPLMLSRSRRIDDRIRRLWLPIATRTVQWVAGRERGLDWKRSPLNV